NNINNFTTLNDIANQLKEELAELKITYNIASSLPSLSYQPLLLPIVSEYVRQHNISETKNLKLSIFLDYKKNLIISVSGQVMLPIFSEKLEEYIFEIGGDFTIKDDESETHHIISLPNHLLKF
ncbi:MAG: hypothetical protein HON42_02480, partial [Alphaproteobacteria bacterium]|nr:hypothetical protein [Alphaproteobacteria bacterium]